MKLDRRHRHDRFLKGSRAHLHAVRATRHGKHLHRDLLLRLRAALFDPYFFIGYLIGMAFFGLFQAIFMANAVALGTTPRRSSKWI